VLGKQETKGSDFAIGLVVAVERLDRYATLAIARKLTDLDGGLGVGGNQ